MMLALLWNFARPYRRSYLGGLGLLVLTNALALSLPWLLREAIEALTNGTTRGTVVALAGAMTAVALIQAFVRTRSRLAILGASRQIVADIRSRFFAQLQRLSASYFDHHHTGDLMSRGVNDIRLLRVFYGFCAMGLMNATMVYVGVLILLFRIDGELTLWALLLYPPLFVGVKWVSRLVYARSLAAQQQLAAISSHVQENLSGIQQVKTFVREEREIQAFGELCAEMRRRNLAMVTLRGAMIALIGIVSGFGTLVVLFAGGRHVIEGRITFGDFVAFNSYIGLLVGPTIQLGWLINAFQRGAGAMERLQEVFRETPEIPPAAEESGEGPQAGGALAGGESTLEPRIEIRGLHFSYDAAPLDTTRSQPARRPADPDQPIHRGIERGRVLRGIDLSIPAGGRVALVGVVGSGKSTLLNLIARIYAAPPRTVFIGGKDVTELPTSLVRRMIGYVPQDSLLFSRSIRENILFGCPDAGEEALTRAVALAHLEAEIESFPKGLDTLVGERGVTLSGGQRQRITIARAALMRPRLLLLDDALSSVDADTERAILRELQRFMASCTCLVVSQRLTALTGMERIVVLEDGCIVEQGSHAELLGQEGRYAKLFQRQELAARLEEG